MIREDLAKHASAILRIRHLRRLNGPSGWPAGLRTVLRYPMAQAHIFSVERRGFARANA